MLDESHEKRALRYFPTLILASFADASRRFRISHIGVGLLLTALEGNSTLLCLSLVGCAPSKEQLQQVTVQGRARCCLRPEHLGQRNHELTSLGIYDPQEEPCMGRSVWRLWIDAEVDASGRLENYTGVVVADLLL